MWEIDWYQNEWPWPLFRGRIKVTSTIALHFTLNISETIRDRGLVTMEHQQDISCWCSIVLWAIEWSRDRWRHVTLKGQTRDPNMLRAQYLENYWATDFKFGKQLCMAIPSGRTNNFPWKRVGPRSRDPYNFWHTIERESAVWQYGRLS